MVAATDSRIPCRICQRYEVQKQVMKCKRGREGKIHHRYGREGDAREEARVNCQSLLSDEWILQVRYLRIEALHVSHNLLQRSKPLFQLDLDNILRLTQLGVEILPVRACLHSECEDGSNEHTVMWAKCGAVCVGEAGCEFLVLVVDRVAHGLSGEVEATKEPHKAFSGGAFRGAAGAFSLDELLECAGLRGAGLVQTCVDFLLRVCRRSKIGL